MRLITAGRLVEFGRLYADARGALDVWRERAEAAEWRSLAETRRTFPHADEVVVGSGRRVTVFNVRGNNYRLITAIHYNTGIVYVMRLLTHAEYDKDAWKDTL